MKFTEWRLKAAVNVPSDSSDVGQTKSLRCPTEISKRWCEEVSGSRHHYPPLFRLRCVWIYFSRSQEMCVQFGNCIYLAQMLGLRNAAVWITAFYAWLIFWTLSFNSSWITKYNIKWNLQNTIEIFKDNTKHVPGTNDNKLGLRNAPP